MLADVCLYEHNGEVVKPLPLFVKSHDIWSVGHYDGRWLILPNSIVKFHIVKPQLIP